MRNILLLLVMLSSSLIFPSDAQCAKWDIACQAYTFKEFTLNEALTKMEKLNIRFVELFPKQKMAPGDDRTTHFTMPDEQIQELKALLKKHHIVATSYGVISPKKESDWKQLFEFAHTMGIKTIVSEPLQEQLEMVDALCQKYKIRLAIHNHPDPTRYWNPDIVLKALEGRSKYIGACTDLGHWTRSGLDATECLKKLEGHVFEVHMKDVNRTDKQGHAIVWGEGIINWKNVFNELKRQKFVGKFVIEHEVNWSNPVPDLEKNIAFFKHAHK